MLKYVLDNSHDRKGLVVDYLLQQGIGKIRFCFQEQQDSGVRRATAYP